MDPAAVLATDANRRPRSRRRRPRRGSWIPGSCHTRCHLLDVKKSPVERIRLTFTSFADDLAQRLEEGEPGAAERSVLVEEVKVGCTMRVIEK